MVARQNQQIALYIQQASYPRYVSTAESRLKKTSLPPGEIAQRVRKGKAQSMRHLYATFLYLGLLY